MPSLREAQIRHAKHFEGVLRSAIGLYRQGGESVKRGRAALFEYFIWNGRISVPGRRALKPTQREIMLPRNCVAIILIPGYTCSACVNLHKSKSDGGNSHCPTLDA